MSRGFDLVSEGLSCKNAVKFCVWADAGGSTHMHDGEKYINGAINNLTEQGASEARTNLHAIYSRTSNQELKDEIKKVLDKIEEKYPSNVPMAAGAGNAVS